MNYLKNKEIAYSELDGEICIFHPETGEYYNLNKTGTFIWNLIEERKTESELISKAEEIFDDKSQNLRDDILGFLKEGINLGIISAFDV